MQASSNKLWVLFLAILLLGQLDLSADPSRSFFQPVPVDATDASTDPPATPTDLSGTFNADNDMELTWTGSDGALHYVVDRQNIATGAWSNAFATTGISCQYTDTSAHLSYAGYAYRVSASNDSGASASTGAFPSARYVVVDLGANKFPMKVTNSGYVLSTDSTNTTYSCFVNGSPVVFGPKNSGDKFHVHDITEDGTAVGEETTATNNSHGDDLIRTGIEKWTITTNSPPNLVPNTPDYEAGNGDAGNDGAICGYINIEVYYGDGQFVDNWSQTPSETTHRTMASGYNIDAAHHIWSNRYISVLTNTPVAILDEYMDTNSLGTMNSNAIGNQIEIIEVTSGGKALVETDHYTIGGGDGYADATSVDYSLKDGTNNHALPFFPNDLNDAGFVVGQSTNTSFSMAGVWWPGNGPVKYFDDGFVPTTVNKAMSGGLPAYQAIGSGFLREMNPSAGSITNATFKPRIKLNDVLPPGSGWSNFACTVNPYRFCSPFDGGPTHSINDSGAVIGGAVYVGTNMSIASGYHGVLLLPYQLRLLNGDTNAADIDGLDFDGSRPTTANDSDLYPDNSDTSADHSDSGFDSSTWVLGECPMATGSLSHNGYYCTLLVAAKVSPNAAADGLTFVWSRTVQHRGWNIQKSAGSTQWTVTKETFPTGFPTPINDSDSVHSTTTPSSKSILYSYDSTGSDLADLTDYAIGDINLVEKKFIYTLTITKGSNVLAVVNYPIGQAIKAKRQALTGNVWEDWMGLGCRASSTDIPTCVITEKKVRDLVHGSLPIVIDSHANDN